MSLLNDVNDYVDFARANHYIRVPLLLQLSQRMLQLVVNPSNVWQVLLRIVQKPGLAEVCDEACSNSLRKFQPFHFKATFSGVDNSDQRVSLQPQRQWFYQKDDYLLSLFGPDAHQFRE